MDPTTPQPNTPPQADPEQIGMNLKILKVKIISPRKDYFDGLALSVSSENPMGKFDILPKHANFITMIKNAPITIRKEDKEKVVFNFPMAIIYTSSNNVKIYTDIQIQLPTV